MPRSVLPENIDGLINLLVLGESPLDLPKDYQQFLAMCLAAFAALKEESDEAAEKFVLYILAHIDESIARLAPKETPCPTPGL